jgi:hypothetical protein
MDLTANCLSKSELFSILEDIESFNIKGDRINISRVEE